MKANGRFFGVMFVFNMIFGLIGFLITWGIRALTSESMVALVICLVIFTTIADYINLLVVKKAKLMTVYVLYGPAINLIFLVVPTVLTMVL